MKHWQRFIFIFSLFLVSIVVVNFSTKSPRAITSHAFHIACIPMEKSPTFDRNLIPYAQIAHTTYSEQNPQKELRCYLRFRPRDLICVPKKVATKKNIECCPKYPAIPGNSAKHCYILNPTHRQLLELLQKKPSVPLETYADPKKDIVNTWQEARDKLLGQKNN